VADRIERQRLDTEHPLLLGQRLAGAAQHGANPCGQLGGRERLGHVVVGPGLETVDLVVTLGTRGQHDHRQPRGRWIGLEHRQQIESGLAGQHPVEKHQVDVARGEVLARLHPIGRFEQLETGA
jgi:hypothetical protein